MESLYEADEIIDQNLTQEGRLRSLVDVSIDLLGAETSSILLWDEYKDGFTVIASRGFKSQENLKILIPGKESVIREAALQGELLIINELSDEYLSAHLEDKMLNFLYNEGIRCSIFLPIIVTNQLFGLLNVNYYQANSIGEEELRVFKSLTQHSAISIHNAQLFEQLREVAINDERRRLARDLHDSAKQKAFAALAQIGAAGGIIDQDPTASKEHLLEAEDLVHEVLQELIILIQEMYPVALREKGLANSVREYVYDWQNQCNIEVSLNIQDERKLPLEIEQSLYRVIQESLANIARHSQADQVELDLSYMDEEIIVQISDDGVGFDVQDQQSGLGLRSMQERIDLINGTLVITSIPDEGTMVNLSAPI
jgi:signal transduction histidine kinase